jgi:hypothetical protein
MDVAKILADLRLQRECIDKAIQAVEILQASRPKRRGRPPKILSGGLTKKQNAHENSHPGIGSSKVRGAGASST